MDTVSTEPGTIDVAYGGADAENPSANPRCAVRGRAGSILPGTMAIVPSPDRYSELREVLRALQPPFLLHHLGATPDDYEAITDEDLKCEYLDGELIVREA